VEPRLLANARVGHLATVTGEGGPHLVSCCLTHPAYRGTLAPIGAGRYAAVSGESDPSGGPIFDTPSRRFGAAMSKTVGGYVHL
jgi:hypothetical protein